MQSMFYERRQKRQYYTARNILYLFLAFPLALIYFVLLVVGLSVGIGTMIIWIGIPILLLTILGIRGMAALERELVTGLLDIPLPQEIDRYRHEKGWRRWFRAQILDLSTWKACLYLLIKFPLSIVSFCITLSFVLTSIGLILAPLGYVIATAILQAHGIHADSNPPAWLQPYTINVTGVFSMVDFVKSFIVSLIGVGFWLISRLLINGMAWISGEIARVFLTNPERHMEMPKYEYQSTGERL